MSKSRLVDPFSTKAIIRSLFMLNPGRLFTTNEIIKQFNWSCNDANQAQIRSYIRVLRNEGMPIVGQKFYSKDAGRIREHYTLKNAPIFKE